ncbi:MAG: hypothetical protein UT77_C0001G0263 [Candidatus Daviesbacteria bacterium GW2011_GWC2_40_12]|uniref:SHOCT domain-containing protein n=1 Tax=Candidatus Daviesbacteria bacterium GW2011_GWC2_40_12 TaxID=1618431 RepID=A0A0G0TXT5_9BACT|nr:MAG: hypothetical protein UT45_C0001G0110 [Candidatus Daviesbacteria bacterium GW2011_GWA2_39_33]KKR42812.1 MAG: hypothetical protein UT77_C0001G0263 [Candidatus Daviesbacteria bacterium GW2011_GWC2_40_12]
MKKFLTIIILLLIIIIQPVNTFAQGSINPLQAGSQSAVSPNGHTAREEAEGKEIWDKLQSKQLECKNITDNQYGSLGEYFMGQMMGSSHEAMNNMMIQMMGEEGEEQMHIAMGKRLSSCDPDAQLPANGIGFMPMMWMMKGGGNSMMGPGFGMMNGWSGNGWSGFGVLGWIFMLAFWLLIILGVVTLIRYLARSGQGKGDKSSLDILKERYARGEIDKKEFEEKKKDLL